MKQLLTLDQERAIYAMDMLRTVAYTLLIIQFIFIQAYTFMYSFYGQYTKDKVELVELSAGHDRKANKFYAD